MSDLTKDAASMAKGSVGLLRAPHHMAKPLHDFKAASHDLSALGALGSLLKATGDIRDGMNTLSALTISLGEEWNAEAKLLGEVSDAFDLLDVLHPHRSHPHRRLPHRPLPPPHPASHHRPLPPQGGAGSLVGRSRPLGNRGSSG